MAIPSVQGLLDHMQGKKPAPERKFWRGSAPSGCQIGELEGLSCATKRLVEFVDGATKMGPWATMCKPCHRRAGRGLGTGLGQLYKKEADGVYYKVKG